MTLGEHPQPECCEVRGCTSRSFGRSLYRAKNATSQIWLCLYHLDKQQERVTTRILKGRVGAEIERDYEEYNRKRLGPVGGLIYDRELSFSEKVAQLDFLYS